MRALLRYFRGNAFLAQKDRPSCFRFMFRRPRHQATCVGAASLMMATQWPAAMGDHQPDVLAIKFAPQIAALLWFFRPERWAVMTPLGAHSIH